MKDLISIALSSVALGISACAFWRTLFQDRVVADLVFEWSQTLGKAVGKLVIDNPLRQSLYLAGIRFREPNRDAVDVWVNSDGLHDVLTDVHQQITSSDRDRAVINQRIQPKGNLEIVLGFRQDSTGLSIKFEWSKHTPRLASFLMPRSLKFSANDIEVMKRTAKRGKP